MAAEARRTPAKVKSSAIMPRQPEVPKWIALPVIGRYCIVQRKSQREIVARFCRGGCFSPPGFRPPSGQSAGADVRTLDDAISNYPGNLRIENRSQENRPRACGAPLGRLREYRNSARRIDVPLEGKRRIVEGIPAGDQIYSKPFPSATARNRAAAQLRRPRNHCRRNFRGNAKVSQLARRIGERKVAPLDGRQRLLQIRDQVLYI